MTLRGSRQTRETVVLFADASTLQFFAAEASSFLQLKRNLSDLLAKMSLKNLKITKWNTVLQLKSFWLSTTQNIYFLCLEE